MRPQLRQHATRSCSGEKLRNQIIKPSKVQLELEGKLDSKEAWGRGKHGRRITVAWLGGGRGGGGTFGLAPGGKPSVAPCVTEGSVAGCALIFEVQRSARSEARKEEARKQEIEQQQQSGLDHHPEKHHGDVDKKFYGNGDRKLGGIKRKEQAQQLLDENREQGPGLLSTIYDRNADRSRTTNRIVGEERRLTGSKWRRWKHTTQATVRQEESSSMGEWLVPFFRIKRGFRKWERGENLSP
ncbi:hypothetical protein KSP40_PGU008172 [Platanthera guangdongensis]|uniref:Uncharacterized protein n=1 Tax=Platanthera guangdongensis TaxID=2320717 RepID=A0ABR2MXM6_9ASPA